MVPGLQGYRTGQEITVCIMLCSRKGSLLFFPLEVQGTDLFRKCHGWGRSLESNKTNQMPGESQWLVGSLSQSLLVINDEEGEGQCQTLSTEQSPYSPSSLRSPWLGTLLCCPCWFFSRLSESDVTWYMIECTLDANVFQSTISHAWCQQGQHSRGRGQEDYKFRASLGLYQDSIFEKWGTNLNYSEKTSWSHQMALHKNLRGNRKSLFPVLQSSRQWQSILSID